MSNYDKQMSRLGTITMGLAIIGNFCPAIFLMIKGYTLDFSQIMTIWGLAAATYGVSWVVQVISYYPTLGETGTYVCWVAGSAADIRMPAAAMARKVAEVEDGTPQGNVMSTIGVACSVFVSTGIITIFTILGVGVINALPASVTAAFSYVSPALFGAVFIDMAMRNLKVGGVTLAVCIGLLFALRAIGIPAGYHVLICVVFGVLIARIFFTMDKKKESAQA